MTRAPPALADEIKTLADFGHDLSSAPEFGFTLGQDDCWDCARAIKAVLLDYSRLEALGAPQ